MTHDIVELCHRTNKLPDDLLTMFSKEFGVVKHRDYFIISTKLSHADPRFTVLENMLIHNQHLAKLFRVRQWAFIEELMRKMFHPRNLYKFDDWGFGLDDD